MITLRKAEDRGHFDFGWLDTYHTFSFGEYHDPEQMGFRTLRVINEDRVGPGQGFPTHSHRDMEIVTVILEGTLEHKDSMGNGSMIRPGEVQRMSAGTGVTHSEYNPSSKESTHLLQIWILPERKGIAPGYEQKKFSEEERTGRLRLIASRDGREGSVMIHQDASVYSLLLEAGREVEHRIRPGRSAWVQMVRGEALVNGKPLKPSDGAAVSGEDVLVFGGKKRAGLLLFDLG